MIQIENLEFSYGRHEVFRAISLQLEAGRIYGLLGENGVGKTTLLRILCGLLRSKGGKCTVDGHRPSDRLPEFLRDICYIPETFKAPGISVKEFVSSRSPLYPRFDPDLFHRLMQLFEVDPAAAFNRLSQGQQKKALISYALSLRTRLLLMDEPSNGLDIPSKALLRKVIAECATEETTFIISTHQVRDLENLIDPIIILDREGILLKAGIEEITERLFFTVEPTVRPDALYHENTLGGILQVVPNSDGTESRVNLEALFNAALRNKDRFREWFSAKS